MAVAPGLLAVWWHPISDNFRVLNENDDIPGLYAIGNCAGDIYAVDYPINIQGNQPRALPRAGAEVPRRTAGRRVPGDLVSAEAAKIGGQLLRRLLRGGGDVGGSSRKLWKLRKSWKRLTRSRRSGSWKRLYAQLPAMEEGRGAGATRSAAEVARPGEGGEPAGRPSSSGLRRWWPRRGLRVAGAERLSVGGRRGDAAEGRRTWATLHASR